MQCRPCTEDELSVGTYIPPHTPAREEFERVYILESS